MPVYYTRGEGASVPATVLEDGPTRICTSRRAMRRWLRCHGLRMDHRWHSPTSLSPEIVLWTPVRDHHRQVVGRVERVHDTYESPADPGDDRKLRRAVRATFRRLR